ncbi:hypothetical protein [uncultured Aquimarina sp.]|uniref:hypothetical protein n=1 Tax=uncultured Aquimarina sp. TaxID=575652 RepID=UPI00261DB3CB|nr:hypothetical protein [uncultured Aquimarina sp.]
MKKTTYLILIGCFLLLIQSCSVDEQEVLEENQKITEEFTSKTEEATTTDSSAFRICQIVYIFNDPTITPSEKEIIRKWYHNNYFAIYDYTVISYYKEIWFVNCQDFDDYYEDNPNCDTDGCYSCVRDGCGSGGSKPKDPVEDPLEDSRH